eukprot:gene48772-52888_t
MRAALATAAALMAAAAAGGAAPCPAGEVHAQLIVDDPQEPMDPDYSPCGCVTVAAFKKNCAPGRWTPGASGFNNPDGVYFACADDKSARCDVPMSLHAAAVSAAPCPKGEVHAQLIVGDPQEPFAPDIGPCSCVANSTFVKNCAPGKWSPGRAGFDGNG